VSKHLQCGDVVDGCKAKFVAESEDQILREVAAHAAKDHGITDVSPDMVAKVRAAIHEG
jgi:predicted small metal-binding protein